MICNCRSASCCYFSSQTEHHYCSSLLYINDAHTDHHPRLMTPWSCCCLWNHPCCSWAVAPKLYYLTEPPALAQKRRNFKNRFDSSHFVFCTVCTSVWRRVPTFFSYFILFFIILHLEKLHSAFIWVNFIFQEHPDYTLSWNWFKNLSQTWHGDIKTDHT